MDPTSLLNPFLRLRLLHLARLRLLGLPDLPLLLLRLHGIKRADLGQFTLRLHSALGARTSVVPLCGRHVPRRGLQFHVSPFGPKIRVSITFSFVIDRLNRWRGTI